MSNSIYIDTTTQTHEININTTTQTNEVGVFVDDKFVVWGTIFGVLSTQTDLWSQLSAKALNTDLFTLSSSFTNLETLVKTFSSTWEESAEILPTVIHYLSSSLITLNEVNVNTRILSGGRDLADIFLTSESDSQTLNWNPSNYELSISNGNIVSLASLSSTPQQQDINTLVIQNSANWNYGYNVATIYQNVSSTFATNSQLTALSSELLQNLTLATNVKILSQNEYALSANKYNVFFKTVSDDNTFQYFNFSNGQTITLYLSASHGTVKRHTLPSPTYIGGNVSESNEIYTYEGHITKTTLQRIGNEYYGVSNLIKTNINQNIGSIGRLLLEQGDKLLQENSYNLLFEIN